MTGYRISVKLITNIFLIALSAGLVACSSVPEKVNEGKLRADTFSFLPLKASVTNTFADNRAHMHAAIQESITSHMSAKGISKVEEKGDLSVGYLVIVASNMLTVAINDYFGYGEDNDALLKKAHKGSRKHQEEDDVSRIRDTYEAGALVIDVMDAKTMELKYRNFAYREILKDNTAEVRTERIQEAVDEALADFRVKSAK